MNPQNHAKIIISGQFQTREPASSSAQRDIKNVSIVKNRKTFIRNRKNCIPIFENHLTNGIFVGEGVIDFS